MFGSPVARFERIVDRADPEKVQLDLVLTNFRNGQSRRKFWLRIDLLNAQTGRQTGHFKEFSISIDQSTLSTKFPIPVDEVQSYLFEVSVLKPWYKRIWSSWWRWWLKQSPDKTVYFRSQIFFVSEHFRFQSNPLPGQPPLSDSLVPAAAALQQTTDKSSSGKTHQQGPKQARSGKFRQASSPKKQPDRSFSRQHFSSSARRLSVKLINAVDSGNLSAVEALLNQGASPNYSAGAPIMKAIHRGSFEIVAAMSERLNCRTVDRFALISRAAEDNHLSIVILLTNKCLKPLPFAFSLILRVINNQLEELKADLVSAAYWSLSSKFIEILVFLSVLQNHMTMLAYFMDECQQVTEQMVFSAMQMSIRIGRETPMIDMLLQKCIDNGFSDTLPRAVLTGIKYDRLPLVRYLLERIRLEHGDIVALSLQSSSLSPSLEGEEIIAEEDNSINSSNISYRITSQQSRKLQSNYYEMFYVAAIRRGSVDMVKLLVEFGYPIAQHLNYFVRLSVQDNAIGVLAYLADEHGADLHFDNEWPLAEAAKRGHVDIIKYLIIEKNANVHAKDDQALVLAVDAKHASAVQELKRLGARLSGEC